jgi:hypothetical protein
MLPKSKVVSKFVEDVVEVVVTPLDAKLRRRTMLMTMMVMMMMQRAHCCCCCW